MHHLQGFYQRRAHLAFSPEIIDVSAKRKGCGRGSRPAHAIYYPICASISAAVKSDIITDLNS